MHSIYLIKRRHLGFINLFWLFLFILFCSDDKEAEYTDLLSDSCIDAGPDYTDDIGIVDVDISRKTVKISVRNNISNSDKADKIFIYGFFGESKLLPDLNTLVFRSEWVTNKTITINLEENEGIFVLLDNNADNTVNDGDYFGILRSSELKDGGRYLVSINSYIPFERVGDQGLNGNEIFVFERIKDSLFHAEGLSMLITKVDDEYFVYSRRGVVAFKRVLSDGEYVYPVRVISGVNPIENTNEKYLSTYSEEIRAGKNPKNTQYQSAGYVENDERLSFIEEEDTSYPFAYERIAQLFDDPNSGDIIGLPQPYGDGLYEIGAHGSLDITQSRSPLIFSGKGVFKGMIYDKSVKVVDIAPTVIKILGGSKIIGVNKYNQLTSENYLRRQDGDVIEEIVNGEIAEYAIIIVSDGLSHTELDRAFADSNYNIPNLRSLFADGVYFKYGHITNYFSVTIPSHNSIGTGVYAGHHGIVNNLYYLRDSGRLLTLIDLGVAPSRYLREEIETIFEAYHRNFGRYDPKSNRTGKFTASINQPCTRGATYATLESLIYNFSSYKYEPLPIIEELKQVTSADNTAVNQMIYLFEKGELPIPNLVMINLTSTDGAGHTWGPHSDMVKRVLEQTDYRIGIIMNLYKKAGIFDKTLFVFTSDHGMEIQDRNRSFEYNIEGVNVSVPLLDTLGVKYVGGLPFIYLKTMAYKINRALSAGEHSYKFYVYDEDKKSPINTVKISVEQNNSKYECLTDERGECLLDMRLTQGEVIIKIEHNSYNLFSEKMVVE
ncbi:MAG: alkaline phosphatase family protein [Deltaproteobacteria bacterium]|nr:alkaline phosphatase family protein [Deltaproteobacteria bacterium]